MNSHDLAADLAARFRLDKRRRSWGGDCPACAYPRAFSIRVGEGARPLLFCANGCTRDVLHEVARSALGNAWTPGPAPDAADVQVARARKQAAALRLFAGSTPTSPSDPAGRYLARRGMAPLIGCPALRYRGDCPHPEGGRLPALVAEVVDAAGRAVAAHRTFLTPEGAKASADPVKASFGPVWGGAVRLTSDPALPPELMPGEGIETAASAGVLLGLPAWAATSAGNLAAGLILPPEVRAVTIAADPDPPGRKAAHDAAARWRAEGHTVRIATPDMPRQDFNDLLQVGTRARGLAAHG